MSKECSIQWQWYKRIESWRCGWGVGLRGAGSGFKFCRASASFHFSHLLTQMFALEQAFHFCHFSSMGNKMLLMGSPSLFFIPLYPSNFPSLSWNDSAQNDSEVTQYSSSLYAKAKLFILLVWRTAFPDSPLYSYHWLCTGLHISSLSHHFSLFVVGGCYFISWLPSPEIVTQKLY